MYTRRHAEIKTKTKLRSSVYYGTSKTTDVLSASMDIIITSYGTLVSEHNKNKVHTCLYACNICTYTSVCETGIIVVFRHMEENCVG